MVYLAVLALIGACCATAFRWPAMLILSALVAGASAAVRWWSAGAPHLGSTVVTALTAFVVVQMAYVLGGLVLTVRPRSLEAKKNLKV